MSNDAAPPAAPPSTRPPRRWLAWAIVAVCGLSIVGLGGDSFSHDQTSRYLSPVVRFFLPWLSDEAHELVLVLIRKTAHFLEYGLFAILSLRAVLVSVRWPLLLAAGAALGMSLALAGFDEFRQGFSNVREGSAIDVTIDLAGSVSALLCFIALERRLGRSLFRWPGERSASRLRFPPSARGSDRPGP